MPEESPVEKSLWMDCFYEVAKKAKEEGRKTVEFSDVDDLVVEKSYSIVEYKFKEEKTNGLSKNTPV
jgi:hypothetical protein